MRIVFWISIAGILYTYLGYPLIMWALARVRPQPWSSAPIQPDLSVVLAVHNGIELLPGKIHHLLELDYPNIKEIIVVSDGSNDGTEQLLSPPQPSPIRTVILEEHGGKAVAVNAGVAEATAEIILFMDIRPQAAPGAIERLVSNFADPTVGCVAGELILRDEGHDAACKAVGGLYWRYEQLIRKCESSFDSPVGVYGGFYAIRRALFVEQPAGIILDDMFEPLSIIRQGYRSVLDSEACVYDTWPKKVKGEFHRKVRTLAGNFQLFRLAPWTLGFSNRVWFQLISHKVLRLVVPYLLISLLVSEAELATQSWLYAAFATAGVLGLIASLIGLSFEIPGFQRFVAPASALLALNAAAVVGLYKFLFVRGPLWKIWNSGKPVAATPSFRSDSITPTEHEVVATAAVKRT